VADVTIRAYVEGDAPALATLFFASVREAGLRDYTDEQVAAWAPEPLDPHRFHLWATDGRTVLVAVNNHDEPVAYCDLEADGHIDHLFCRPDFVGLGVASRLYEALEAIALSRRVPRLYVEASEAARRLFVRKGFSIVERRDLVRRGVAIHNYAMAKTLV
jgi:putative acetyltransferase